MTTDTLSKNGGFLLDDTYGPGGVIDAYGEPMPLLNKAALITNNRTDYDLFIPTNTAEEKAAFYNYIGQTSDVEVLYGQYIYNNYLWNNTASIGTGGPCWNGTPGGSYADPPSVPAGFSEDSVVNAACQPYLWSGEPATVHQSDVGWMFFMTMHWGCAMPGYQWQKASVRKGKAGPGPGP